MTAAQWIAILNLQEGSKMEKYYNVFHRTWWSMEDGKRVARPGKKTYIEKHVTYGDARELCSQYNSTHEPGELSRKAEFEEAE